jgi:predicted TIM-barrel fold metal-dependent hydrolase
VKTSAEVRSTVGHPIIDVDGHMLEVLAAAEPFVRQALGPDLYAHWSARRAQSVSARNGLGPEQRKRTRIPQSSWWGGAPASNARDRASAALPALLHERMDELGMDFTVLYPTNTLGTGTIVHPELRRGLCQGFNEFYAAIYGEFADRMTPAGIIPMHSPEEAVAELEHCHSLGLKVVCFPEGVIRPIDEPSPGEAAGWMYPGQTHWFDSFGLDSAYDYDPVWQACKELGFVAAFHGGLSSRPGVCWSISSYVANHVGQFALSMYPLCKSLLFGGVTKRFPDLPIVLLECGVSWAAQMLLDTVEHWEKRNIEAVHSRLNPELLDHDEVVAYYRTYGQRMAELAGEELFEQLRHLPIHGATPEELDEFIHMGVDDPADIVHRFVDSFYFGCEADDRGIASAYSRFNTEVHGTTFSLRALLSSDIGHWDVTDMTDVVAESHELVEDGYLTPDQWREIVFENPVEMYRRANPTFFDGTPVGDYLARQVATPQDA